LPLSLASDLLQHFFALFQFEQNVDWSDIQWIKQEAPNVPLVVKGIMTAEDAELAILAGADGIMVSNHGGRQLDGCFATIDALPDIATVVAGRVPIWLDGGIRRGTVSIPICYISRLLFRDQFLMQYIFSTFKDILKALALGASAVGIGKPLFFALSVGGEDAVSYMLELLQTELEAAMAICGIESVSDITPNHVARHPIYRSNASHFRSSL
jgi:isopentenyl diphosphate isomerase/L-lactate dehydrogenase-like FMN-dependent dehydrogenase